MFIPDAYTEAVLVIQIVGNDVKFMKLESYN